MFGRVEFTLKPAPGVGIVSSAVMQSDDLDEIDWEWLGGDSNQVQSNYFGKGQTTTYNRGGFHPNPNNQADFHTYTIDWTADQIAWQIDGRTVRTLTPQTAATGQYPQTPMMIKVGAWSGGDPNLDAPGTVRKHYYELGAGHTLIHYRVGWWCYQLRCWTFHYVCEVHRCHRLFDGNPIYLLGHGRYLAIHQIDRRDYQFERQGRNSSRLVSTSCNIRI